MCFPDKNNYLTHEIFSCYLNVKPISFRHRLISRFLYFFFILALKTSTLSSYSFVEITERLLRPIIFQDIWRDMKSCSLGCQRFFTVLCPHVPPLSLRERKDLWHPSYRYKSRRNVSKWYWSFVIRMIYLWICDWMWSDEIY